MIKSSRLLTNIIFVTLLSALFADDYDHKYKVNEPVVLWVNHIGPYHNPQETYPYYQLPFCKPSHGIETKKKSSGIGEILEGNQLRNSGVKMEYTVDVEREDICDMTLDESTVAEFELAIDRQYWYELILDDLPMWGMVGETLRDESLGRMLKHVFTHRSLSIAYNENRIIEVNLTSENPVPLTAGQALQFTYTVRWKHTEKPFDSRFNRYLEYDFFEHKIHWFSVFNSFMMVIFLCGLVALILLRTLRNDFARYSKDDDLDVEGMQVIGEDTGWKQVHGDVFRAPEYLELFSAIIGTGWQLVWLILVVIVYAMLGPILHGNMYEDRGEMISTIIICFSLSSSISGYVSGSFYRKFFLTARSEQNSHWQQTMVYTILLFPSIIAAIVFMLNSIASFYDTISVIPFWTVVMPLTAVYGLVVFPLAVLGTVLGRHLSSKYDPPCRVNSIPRPIPLASWYCNPLFVIPVSGLLPFGSIFIEMYFIFTAFWSYKFYYVYGFMLLVYTILSLVTICTTIVAVYFILNAENYNWQWIALSSSGSTSVYVFLYSVFYFYYKTQMTGLLQIAYYFGYMSLFCVALFFMCAALGVWGANLFVNKIYRNVKID